MSLPSEVSGRRRSPSNTRFWGFCFFGFWFLVSLAVLKNDGLDSGKQTKGYRREGGGRMG